MNQLKETLLKVPVVRKVAKKTKEVRHWIGAGHIARKVNVRRWLRKEKKKILQIGCGPHKIDGAMNADIINGDIYIDATEKMPIPSDSVDFIFTEQFIEHLSYEEGRFFVTEAHRILKPGGVLRQATPSLEGLIKVYNGENKYVDTEEAIERHRKNHSRISTKTEAQFLNDFFRLWNHKLIYDKKTLKKLHEGVGFEKLEWKNFGESEYNKLRNLERHADVEWMKKAFVIICEAEKKA